MKTKTSAKHGDAASVLGDRGLAELYQTVPAQNASARQLPLDEGLVLDVPLRQGLIARSWLSWFVPLRSHRRIHLDELGTQVFRLCDGRRNVEAIIERFAEPHRLTFHESRAAVVSFLRSLIQRGAVAVAIGVTKARAS